MVKNKKVFIGFGVLFVVMFVLGFLFYKNNTNRLVVLTNAYFPPYEYYDDNGELKGIDIEIAQEIAQRLGKEIKIIDTPFDSLITGLVEHQGDVILAAMTVTDERKELISFTDIYATGIQKLVVCSDSDISDIADLDNHIIGVQAGTTGEIYATDSYSNVFAYDKLVDLDKALSTKKIDVIIIDDGPAESLVQSNTNFRLLDTPFSVEDYAIGVNKDNVELLQRINQILKEMKIDGTLDKIQSKYIF